MDGNAIPINSTSEISAANISRGLDDLMKDRLLTDGAYGFESEGEPLAIRWEKAGVFDNEAIQEVMRLKGIPTA